MIRITYILFYIILFSSCFIKRSRNDYSHKDTYGEISDINTHQTPKDIAKDIGNLSKKQQRAYKKQMKKTDKAIRKRNKKKLKNIVVKTKTKKVSISATDKSEIPNGKKVIVK